MVKPTVPCDSFSALVSVPEALVLVRQPQAGTPESALVVPELHQESVTYFRCLVDSADIVEHVIAVGTELWEDEHDRELTQRVLRLRRPIHVSFVKPLAAGRLALLSASPDFRGAVSASAVVEAMAFAEPGVASSAEPRPVIVGFREQSFEVRCCFAERVYKCEASRVDGDQALDEGLTSGARRQSGQRPTT